MTTHDDHAALMLTRLAEDTEALRGNQLHDAASGANDFDYRQMWSLLVPLKSRLDALLGDPRTFVEDGRLNAKAIAAMTQLANVIRQIISDVNKMRNTDRLMVRILEEFTASYSRAIAPQVVSELRSVEERLATLERGLASGDVEPARAAQSLAETRSGIRRYAGSQLVGQISDAAVTTLHTIRSEYKIH